MGSNIIFNIDRGPKVVRITSATLYQQQSQAKTRKYQQNNKKNPTFSSKIDTTAAIKTLT